MGAVRRLSTSRIRAWLSAPPGIEEFKRRDSKEMASRNNDEQHQEGGRA